MVGFGNVYALLKGYDAYFTYKVTILMLSEVNPPVVA